MKPLGYKSVFHIYIIFFVLLIGTLLAGIIMVFYNITIQKPDRQMAISKWTIDFTRNFSEYVFFSSEGPKIEEAGLKLLKENNLWIQIIDSKGDEVQSFNKPENLGSHYAPSDILDIYQNGKDIYSVFFGKVQDGEKEWTYMIGFPIPISKITLYVNKDRFATFKPIVFVMLGVMGLLLVLSSFIYSFRVAKQMNRIRKAIREVVSRTYLPSRERGLFGSIYEELNNLSVEIRTSDEIRAKEEKLREEWIANITHDLKTPLSPIKGYGELISTLDPETDRNELRKYGRIILKNTFYAQELINDLKLTYQLKNGMLPLNMIKQNIVRFTKELVIDLINSPEYTLRNISFFSTRENIEFSFDGGLLRRALNNLFTNALVHNNNDTEISVVIKVEKCIEILIQDNGRGMTKEELENLFTRYYRGGNTTSKVEGSGLGMAIAKQIIELHGGRIGVESTPSIGTCITIQLPKEN